MVYYLHQGALSFHLGPCVKVCRCLKFRPKSGFQDREKGERNLGSGQWSEVQAGPSAG